jgi:hypothetical protein
MLHAGLFSAFEQNRHHRLIGHATVADVPVAPQFFDGLATVAKVFSA